MDRFRPLAALLDGLAEGFGIPACACAVALDGRVVFRHGAGFSDAAGTRPVSPSDTYWIYSATKLVTCIAALRLVERGALALADPVARYLPAFGYLTVREEDGRIRPAREPMLIRHLFTMTAGLDYDLGRPALRAAIADPSSTTRDIASALAKDPLCFEPGEHYLYSLAHDVLGAVVEVVSGQTLSAYIHEHIAGPLGMADTTFHPSPEQLSRLSTQYAHTGPGGAPEVIYQSNPFRLTDRYDSGGAGLMSTVDDYIRLPAALSRGGRAADGYQVLRPETVELMRTPCLGPIPLRDFLARSQADYAFNYGLGVRVLVDGSDTVGTVGQFGWDGAAGAFTIVDPAHRAALFYAQQVCQSARTVQRLHPALREVFGSCLTGKTPRCK